MLKERVFWLLLLLWLCPSFLPRNARPRRPSAIWPSAGCALLCRCRADGRAKSRP